MQWSIMHPPWGVTKCQHPPNCANRPPSWNGVDPRTVQHSLGMRRSSQQRLFAGAFHKEWDNSLVIECLCGQADHAILGT